LFTNTYGSLQTRLYNLIAVTGEDNGDHATLAIIADSFSEVDATADLVTSATRWTKRTTMSV